MELNLVDRIFWSKLSRAVYIGDKSNNSEHTRESKIESREMDHVDTLNFHTVPPDSFCASSESKNKDLSLISVPFELFWTLLLLVYLDLNDSSLTTLWPCTNVHAYTLLYCSTNVSF